MRTRGFGVSAAEKQLCRLQALSKGKRVMETRPNPNPNETNRPFIRVQIGRNAKWSTFSQITPKPQPCLLQGNSSWETQADGAREVWSKVKATVLTAPYLRLAPQTIRCLMIMFLMTLYTTEETWIGGRYQSHFGFSDRYSNRDQTSQISVSSMMILRLHTSKC